MSQTAKTIDTNLLSDDDWEFVHGISIKFPNAKPSIIDRFKFFHAMPKEVRPVQALIGLQHVHRQGLIQRGYNPEHVLSVYEHSQDVKKILIRAYKAGVFDTFLSSEADPLQTLKNAFRKATLHDLQETLTTDFTPSDMDIITRDEKRRLESLAAKILYESYPDRYQAFHEYEEKQGKEDVLVKIADFIAWAGEALNCYATEEYFDDTPPETLTKIFGDTREKMQKYPEAYEAFGSAYLFGMEQISETLLPDVNIARRKNARAASAAIFELALPSAA